MIILGIDPGTSRIGYALVTTHPKFALKKAGVIEIPKEDHARKLAKLRAEIKKLICAWTPDLLALETLFFSKNRKTALTVAEARGVILASAAEAHLTVRELNPTSVKRIVGGHGGSEKAALTRVMERLFGFKIPKGPDDISDAAAIALAAALHSEQVIHNWGGG